MNEKVKGNFDFALMQMISRLKRAENSPPLAKFAQDVLREWDDNRGSDWYTNTKLREECTNPFSQEQWDEIFK